MTQSHHLPALHAEKPAHVLVLRLKPLSRLFLAKHKRTTLYVSNPSFLMAVCDKNHKMSISSLLWRGMRFISMLHFAAFRTKKKTKRSEKRTKRKGKTKPDKSYFLSVFSNCFHCVSYYKLLAK